ncbi:MAG: hypothetical protein ACLGHT_00695 [Acidimicrobiia bacterium]
MSALRRFVAVALVAAALGACGSDDGLDQASGKIELIKSERIPAEVMGLKVQSEDVSKTLSEVERSWAEGVGLYSFRREELVQATLQINRFNDNADYEKSGFRRQILQQIGGTQPRQVQVGEEDVWITQSTKQTLAIWFEGEHLFVLSIRQDFERPRSLLRAALELEV